MVLGLLSIVLGACFVIGLLLGILGLVRSRAGLREVESHPSLGGLGLLKAARFTSIIGIVMGLLQAVLWCVYIVAYLVSTVADPSSTGFVT